MHFSENTYALAEKMLLTIFFCTLAEEILAPLFFQQFRTQESIGSLCSLLELSFDSCNRDTDKMVIIVFIAKARIANWNQIESIYDMHQ